MLNSSSSSQESKITVRKAILIGQLVVNFPAILIMAVSFIAGILSLALLYFRQWWLLPIIGFFLSWLWWSFSVPRWRYWALQKGAPTEELHRAAVASSLEWPKGWIFEKTEIKPHVKKTDNLEKS